METNKVWLVVGFLGQALFTMRFVVQWLQSERMRRSVVPEAFWYFSIFGGLTLLTYSIHRRDPVFIVGQASGLFIYLRNLYFILRERKKLKAYSNPPLD
ncbi:lipid-A-disaccharide synthase N-terminal domain-containing protein [Geobacter sp.]|uniref:lipid-A-disaccharide synthase N-terminal domain-containing protein n=1 Tax=Geobacter sp. TaxID=46610 RepID=UPI001AD437AD|nr:lipid-A-disaccharide synthase N-terminal domain-containing protein [Geobacter sp.]CAG0975690.1 hypothetical protein GEOBC_01523 [Geobacteraceae bacterium]